MPAPKPRNPAAEDAAVQRFGSNLRAAREAAGLSQESVALEADIPQGHYSRIERGEVEPSMRVLVRVAAALGTTLHDLTEGVEV
ncbi:MAG TPA: helix-turn-helix transcriptional regulator [Baekduia sp.]|nr:helix-turn-helix transcriptional regulator [Baekduia sp.]